MSARLEAAVKAWDHHWGDRYGDEALDEMGEEVQVALDAADGVMFSDEAFGYAVSAVRGQISDLTVSEAEAIARDVITALREEA